MIDKPLISVIVPIYNVEVYLRECIDSILSNTYKNLEIILVDDGSPDNCGAICDEYKTADPRIQVIHQKNKGLVGARNAGLAASHGEYISFIDSDDWISPAFYEYMIRTMDEEQADMVACEYRNRENELCMDSNRTDRPYCTETYDKMLSVLTNAPSIRSVTWTGCNVWNKLYKAECIQNYFNPQRLMCEDMQFNWDYIKNCQKLAVLPFPLYFYRINPDGIMGTYRKKHSRPEHGICNAQLWERLSCQAGIDWQLQTYLQGRALYTAHGALLRIVASGKRRDYPEYAAAVRALAKQSFPALWADKSSYDLKIRLAAALLRFAYPIWCTAGALLGRLLK